MTENEIEIQGNVRTKIDKLPGDIWRNIVLRLDRSSMYNLICSGTWIADVLISDNSLWKELLLRILKAPPQYNPIYVYADCLMAGARLGGVIMSSSVWVGALDHALSADLNQHGHFVSNLLPGLWVTDVYNGICHYCEAVCDETITMLSLWHSKLHLMDGFEEFCPDIIDIKHTDSRSDFIVDPSADSLALALSNLLDSRSIKIDGLGLEYKVSEQGLAVEFTDDEAKKLETEFKITRDSMNRVVAIQIQHIGHHIPSMKD